MDKQENWLRENKLSILLGAILIVATFIILIFKVRIDFMEHLLGIRIPENISIITLLLFTCGSMSFFKLTQIASWYILGCATILLIIEGVFFTQNIDINSWAILGLMVVCLIIFTGIAIKLRKSEIEAKKQLQKENEELRSHVEKLNETIRSEKDEHNSKIIKLEKDYINKINSQSESYEKKIYNEVEKRTIAEKRVYESQLVGLFHFAIQEGSYSSEIPFALHYLQGNKDQELADFIGETNSTYWMMELKRDEKDLPNELKKHKRIEQFNALNDSKNIIYRHIGDKCHWLGWGLSKNNDIDILFSSYWNALTSVKNSISPDVDYNLSEFCNNSYSASNPIGVSRDSFYEYVQFLFLSIGETDLSAIENMPVIIFSSKSGGGFTARLETLFSVRKCLPNLEVKIEREKELEKEKENENNWSIGFSR